MSETGQLNPLNTQEPDQLVEGFLVAITFPKDGPAPLNNIDIQNILQGEIVERGFPWTYAEVTPMGIIESLGADLDG